MLKDHYDVLDQGDIYLLSDWEQVSADVWEAQAEAVVMNDWAENLGVPHGSRVRGRFWVQLDDPKTTPDTGEWITWDFDDFEVIEISPQLVEDLAEAAWELAETFRLEKRHFRRPGTALWASAWAELVAGEWPSLPQMLRNVSVREIEELAYKLL